MFNFLGKCVVSLIRLMRTVNRGIKGASWEEARKSRVRLRYGLNTYIPKASAGRGLRVRALEAAADARREPQVFPPRGDRRAEVTALNPPAAVATQV